MATPEGRVKNKVKRWLKEKKGVYQFWPVQSGLGAATLDCMGWYNGEAFAIETKAPGGKMTKRQEHTAFAMREAGAPVFVIDGTDNDDWNHMEAWFASRTRT